MNLGDTLLHNARVRGECEALVVDSLRFTWRQWNEHANRIANALQALGARHGERVLLLLGNRAEFAFAYYGLAKIGCVSAPIMPRAVPGELALVAKSLRARFVIAEAMALPVVQEMRHELGGLEAVIGIGACPEGVLDYEALASRASPEEPSGAVGPDDVLTVKFTSGTTGVPKGCLRTHRNFIDAAMGQLIEIPLEANDAAMVAAPLAAGMAVSQMTLLVMRGVRIILLPFDPGKYLETVQREQATLIYLTDHMSRRLMAHPDFARSDFSSVRIYHAASSRDVVEAVRRHPTFKGGFTSGYASSEGGGLISVKKPELYEAAFADPAKDHLLDCLGHETLLNRVECLDDALNPVPVGAVGEIAIRGASVFQGYWERPDETEKVLRGGWLLTGDLGSKDEDGFLYLRGRKRDVIRSGGLSIYPAEVETVLRSHDGVAAVSVVGVPDRQWHEKLVACVVAKTPCSEEELIDFCRRHLAPYKCPKSVQFFERMPMSGAEKVLKRELVERVMEREANETLQPKR